MLTHLWRSLTAFLKRTRPVKYGMYDTSGLSFAQSDSGKANFGVRIDGDTIKQNADGELCVDPLYLQFALYGLQLNALELQLRDSAKSAQATGALQEMNVRLKAMLEDATAETKAMLENAGPSA